MFMNEPRIISDQVIGDIRQISLETCPRVCSRGIAICVRNEIIEDVVFYGGCSGNTQGVSALLRGMTVDDAIKRLKGIDCGGKGTSCPDQLARGLEKVFHNI